MGIEEGKEEKAFSYFNRAGKFESTSFPTWKFLGSKLFSQTEI